MLEGHYALSTAKATGILQCGEGDIMISDVIAAALILISLIYFSYVGVRHYTEIAKLDDFLIYGRKLQSKDFSDTFVATGLSVATVVVFFMNFGSAYGAAVIWSPISYIASIYFLFWLLKIFSTTERGKDFFETGHSIVHFIKNRYKSNAVSFLFLIVSLASLVSIFIIELFVATLVFGTFEVFSGRGGEYAILIFTTVIVFVYVYLGGFKSIVKTDRVQLAMCGIGFLSLIVGIIYIAVFSDISVNFNSQLLLPNPVGIGPTWQLGLSFLIAFFAINFTLNITYLGNWQRFLAVGDYQKLREGFFGSERRAQGGESSRYRLPGGVIQTTLILWGLLIVAGILSSCIKEGVLPTSDTDMTVALLNYFKDSGSVFLSMIVFPLVVAGIFATLISTADSHIIPIIQSVMYDILPKRLARTSDEGQLKMARTAIAVSLIAALLLYGVLVFWRELGLYSLLFFFFTLVTVLFSPIAYAIIMPNPPKIGAILAISIGLAATYFMSLSDYATPMTSTNAPIVVVVLGVIVMEILSKGAAFRLLRGLRSAEED